MSKFYDEAYKWSLYEKYHNGFTLTELCEISGISDKSLHEWFKRLDYEYAQASVISLSTVRQNSGCTACLPKRCRVGLPHIQKRIYSARFPERFTVS